MSLVTISHPGIAGTAVVTDTAFTETYEPLGWVLVPSGPVSSLPAIAQWAGPWDTHVHYPAGAMVFYGGTVYVALTLTVGDQPDLSPTVWQELALTDAVADRRYTFGRRKGGAFSGTPAALARWQTALAAVRAGTGNARVVFVGDSVTRGDGSAGPRTTTAWPERLRSMLAAYCEPKTRPGVVWFGAPGYVNERYALGSGWAEPNTYGPAGSAVSVGGAGASGTLDFGPIYCDTFEFWYLITGVGGATFDVWVDGGAHTTVTPGTSAGVGSVVVPAGAAGNHTLHVGNIVGTNCYALAGEARVGPAGIYVSRAGVAGSIAQFWAQDALFNSIPCIKAVGADLAVIMLTSGECNNQTPLADYRAAIDALVVAYQSVGASVMLASAPKPGVIRPITWESYVAQLASVAAARNCVVADMGSRWASIDPSLTMVDGLHPNDDGHYDLGRAAYDLLTRP